MLHFLIVVDPGELGFDVIEFEVKTRIDVGPRGPGDGRSAGTDYNFSDFFFESFDCFFVSATEKTVFLG